MNDRDLIRQYARDRSDAAFTQLVERHKNWIYSVCLRRLRNAHLAEDAAQAVLIALARKAPSLVNHQSIMGWLYQAARFVAQDVRKLELRRAKHEAEVAHMLNAPLPDPLDETWSEIAPLLEAALDRLPENYRLPLLLRFYQQKSHAEIATILGISENAAQKRLQSGLQRLRSKIAISRKDKLTLPAASFASLIVTHAVQSAPPTVCAPSISAALAHTSGNAHILSQGALHMMHLAKLKTLAVAASFLIALLGGSAAITYFLSQHHESTAQAQVPPSPAAIAAPTFIASPSSADPRIAFIAPYLSVDTVMIIHIDATTIDTAACEKLLQEVVNSIPAMRPNERETALKKIAALRLTADRFLDPFKKAGGKEFYALFSQPGDAAPRFLAILIPVESAANAAAIADLLKIFGNPNIASSGILSFSDHFLALGSPDDLTSLKSPSTAQRPDLEQALAASSGDIDIAIALPERSRAVFVKHLSDLAREAGGGSIAVLYTSLQHLSLAIHLPPDPHATLLAQFDTPEHAKETVDIFNHMVDAFAATVSAHITTAPPGSIDMLKTALTATPDGTAVKIQFSPDQLRTAVAVTSVILPALAKDKANSARASGLPATYIRQDIMAALMYAADNNGNFPADLHATIDKGYLPNDQTLINPRDAKKRPFEYHPWTGDELKSLDAAATPVLWEAADDGTIPLTVGYADGHVARLPNKAALDNQLDATRAKLKQP